MTSLMSSVHTLLDYGMLVLPGLALMVLCFWLARSSRDPLLRILVLILGFVLIRDGMTPTGLWEFGVSGRSAPWLRMTDSPLILVSFGMGSLVLVALTLRDRALRSLVVWGDARLSTLALGLAGGLLAAAPVVLLSLGTPIQERGGTVALGALPALAFMALAGNLGEEVFFRGYLQGRLEQDMAPVRAAVLSGVLFAACHSYLASTVTQVGWTLLAFTLWEGLICAFLRLRWGVIPAALAHGTAIFLLASGLL